MWDLIKIPSKDKVSLLYPCLGKEELTAPRGLAFHLNLSLFEMQKEGSGILRNANTKDLLYAYLLVLLPCII